jgi:hypothetical protein
LQIGKGHLGVALDENGEIVRWVTEKGHKKFGQSCLRAHRGMKNFVRRISAPISSLNPPTLVKS